MLFAKMIKNQNLNNKRLSKIIIKKYQKFDHFEGKL